MGDRNRTHSVTELSGQGRTGPGINTAGDIPGGEMKRTSDTQGQGQTRQGAPRVGQ